MTKYDYCENCDGTTEDGVCAACEEYKKTHCVFEGGCENDGCQSFEGFYIFGTVGVLGMKGGIEGCCKNCERRHACFCPKCDPESHAEPT